MSRLTAGFTARVPLTFPIVLLLSLACQPAAAPSPQAAATAPPAAQGADPFRVAPRPVKIAIPAEDMTAYPIRIALVENLFSRRGLDVEVHRVNPAVGIAGISAGEFQYINSFAVAMNSTMRGVPIKLVVMMEHDLAAVLVARPDVKTVADLRGKRVAAGSAGGVLENALRVMLQAEGLDPDRDVEIFPLGDAGRVAGFESGQVDAVILDPPQSVLLRDRGNTVVGRAASVLPDVAIAAIAASPERIASDPAEVKAVTAAIIEALQYLHTNREGSARILAEWLQIPNDVALAAYDGSLAAMSKDGTVSESALRRGLEIQRQRDPALTWDGPLTEFVAADLLAEVQRGLRPAAR